MVFGGSLPGYARMRGYTAAVVPDDLLATGIRLEADERRPDGFVLKGRFVPYSTVFKSPNFSAA